MKSKAIIAITYRNIKVLILSPIVRNMFIVMNRHYL